MKKIIYLLSLGLLVSGLTVSCEMSSEKEKAEKATAEAQEDMKEANIATEKAEKDQAWMDFKTEAERKIADNDIRIAELRKQLTKPGKVLDAMYAKRIETLEKQNADMLSKIAAYESSQSDWETFKTEFNRDMEALGKSISDFSSKK